MRPEDELSEDQQEELVLANDDFPGWRADPRVRPEMLSFHDVGPGRKYMVRAYESTADEFTAFVQGEAPGTWEPVCDYLRTLESLSARVHEDHANHVDVVAEGMAAIVERMAVSLLED